jgi:heme/copper-type cytochrome/quinol oxidase subunit 4
MNWKWIGILSLTSIISSLMTVFGTMPEGAMGYVVGFGMGIVLSVIFAKVTADKFFKNGFTLGITAGIVGSLVQMLFFNTMIENNPKMAAQFEQMPSGMNPVVMFAVFAPIGIVISGAIQGFLTWAAAMILGKGGKKKQTPPPMPV